MGIDFNWTEERMPLDIHYWRLLVPGGGYRPDHWQCSRCGADLYGDDNLVATNDCPGKRA